MHRFLLILFSVCSLSINSFSSDTKAQYFLDSIYIYTYYAFTDSIEAANMYSRLENVLETESPTYKNPILMLYKGIIYEGCEMNKQALSIYKETIEECKKDFKKDDNVLYINFCAHLYISNLLAIEYDYLNALEYLYKIELQLLGRKEEWLGDVYNNLSSVYNDIQDYSLTIHYLRKAIEYTNDDALENFLTLRLNFAAWYYQEEQYDQTNFILENIKDSVLGNENTYYDLHETFWAITALTNFQTNQEDKMLEAIEVIDTMAVKDPYYYGKILLLKSQLAADTGNYSVIPEMISKSKEMLGSFKNPHILKNYYSTLTSIYKENPDSLLKFYRLYDLYSDSALRSSNTSTFVSMERRNAIYALDKKYSDLEKKWLIDKELLKTQQYVITIITLLTLAIIASLIVIRLKNKRLKFNISKLVEKNEDLLESFKELNACKDQNKNKLSNTQQEIILHRFKDLLVKEKIFREQELKLPDVAQRLNSNTTYLSEVINNHFKKNFKKLINEYRIQEVLYYLHNEDTNTYTIDYLAKKAGFKSGSSFYKLFKEQTGLAPGIYVKELERKKEEAKV